VEDSAGPADLGEVPVAESSIGSGNPIPVQEDAAPAAQPQPSFGVGASATSTPAGEKSTVEDSAGPADLGEVPVAESSIGSGNPIPVQEDAAPAAQPQPSFGVGASATSTPAAASEREEAAKGLFGDHVQTVGKTKFELTPRDMAPKKTELIATSAPTSTTAMLSKSASRAVYGGVNFAVSRTKFGPKLRAMAPESCSDLLTALESCAKSVGVEEDADLRTVGRCKQQFNTHAACKSKLNAVTELLASDAPDGGMVNSLADLAPTNCDAMQTELDKCYASENVDLKLTPTPHTCKAERKAKASCESKQEAVKLLQEQSSESDPAKTDASASEERVAAPASVGAVKETASTIASTTTAVLPISESVTHF